MSAAADPLPECLIAVYDSGSASHLSLSSLLCLHITVFFSRSFGSGNSPSTDLPQRWIVLLLLMILSTWAPLWRIQVGVVYLMEEAPVLPYKFH